MSKQRDLIEHLKQSWIKSVDEHQDDCSNHLPKLLTAYKTSVHKSTKYSPFHHNCGTFPQLLIDVMMGIGVAGNENHNLSAYTRCSHHSLKTAYHMDRHTMHTISGRETLNNTECVRTTLLVTECGCMLQH